MDYAPFSTIKIFPQLRCSRGFGIQRFCCRLNDMKCNAGQNSKYHVCRIATNTYLIVHHCSDDREEGKSLVFPVFVSGPWGKGCGGRVWLRWCAVRRACTGMIWCTS